MALENITSGAASTIADLDPTSPAGGEDISQGDDHLRNIKKALQFTFLHISDTVSSVASELDFAHKGGTVSGNVQIKGTLTNVGNAVFQGNLKANSLEVSASLSLAGPMRIGSSLSVSNALVVLGATNLNTLAVSATISGSIQYAISSGFAVSASFAYTAQHAVSANYALSALSWGGGQKYASSATPSDTAGAAGDIWFRYD